MTPLNVLYALGWFAFGVVVGAEWTRMRRDVRCIAAAQAEEETVAPQHNVDKEPARSSKRRWARRVLDAFVVLLFLSSAVQAYITYDRIQAVVACQKAYQAGFADALDARSAASAAERDALVAWMVTLDELVTKTQPDPVAARQKFAAATSAYLQKQAELKRKQQEHPYPPSPRDVCLTR